jgi:hypothetical protein
VSGLPEWVHWMGLCIFIQNPVLVLINGKVPLLVVGTTFLVNMGSSSNFMFTNFSVIPGSSSENGSTEDYSSFSSSYYTSSSNELTEFLVNSNAMFRKMVTTNYYYYYHSHHDDTGIQEPAKKKQNRKKKGVVIYTDEDRIRRVLSPTMSLWYNLYVEQSHLESN